MLRQFWVCLASLFALVNAIPSKMVPNVLVEDPSEAVVVSGPANKAVNFTAYRITPQNYTGVTNMDTGDAYGDVFFGIHELSFPIVCSSPSDAENIGCKNIPILSIPNFNVYKEFIIEADARFGEYAECNPDPDNGTFYCTHFNWGPKKCWHDNPAWVQEFSNLCDASQCDCNAVDTLSVGSEVVAFGAGMNASYPATCAPNYRQRMNSTFNQPPQRTVFVGNDEGKCCSLCNETSWCNAYTFYNQSCSLFANATGFGVPLMGASSGSYSETALISAQDGQLAHILNGTWYSTQAAGQCSSTQRVGVDCWWRVVEERRNVNSSCVNNHVVDTIRNKRPECFDACGSQANNISSPCVITCIFDTAAGNPYLSPPVPPMTAEEIVTPFVLSFLTDEESKGGCPTVPPCPPPCKPQATGAEAADGNGNGLGFRRRLPQRFLAEL